MLRAFGIQGLLSYHQTRGRKMAQGQVREYRPELVEQKPEERKPQRPSSPPPAEPRSRRPLVAEKMVAEAFVPLAFSATSGAEVPSPAGSGGDFCGCSSCDWLHCLEDILRRSANAKKHRDSEW